MAKSPEFSLEAAHKFFSAECFNKAWELIEKPHRTPEENEQMIRLNHASLWHWTQRPDCTKRNLSIGYWQAARIYTVLGQGDNARWYGRLCLEVSVAEPPFYRAYAFEALARAETIAGNKQNAREYLAQARDLAKQVSEAEERKALLADLAAID